MKAVGEHYVIDGEKFPGLRRVGEGYLIELTVVQERDIGCFGVTEADVGKTQILMIGIARIVNTKRLRHFGYRHAVNQDAVLSRSTIDGHILHLNVAELSGLVGRGRIIYVGAVFDSKTNGSLAISFIAL